MGEVVPFPRHGHRLHSCNEENCFVCNGGLTLCIVCGGAEGSLPTDCPGRVMTPYQDMLVMSGQQDYYRVQGWVKKGLGQVK